MIFPWLKLIPWAMGGLAALLLFGLGWRISGNMAAGKVAEARAETLALRTAFAEGNAAVLQEQAAMQRDTTEATLAAIQRASEKLSGAIAAASDRAAIATLQKNVSELQKDVNYACRDRSLPDWYTDGLRIPRLQASDPPGNGH